MTNNNKTFLVSSKILDDAKPLFDKAAKVIRKAIDDGRPILLRHHNDCDGYTSGMALERAILPQIGKVQGSMNAWKYFRRAVSRTPYYSYVDAVKDSVNAISDFEKYNRLMPLVVIVDHGSSEENLLSLQKLKIHGAQLLVVDHHNPGTIQNGKAAVDAALEAHVNPWLVGHKSELCAAMLAVELAHLVNPHVKGIDHLAAVGGYGDRCSGTEFDQYVQIAQKGGFDPEYMHKLAGVINWEVFHLGFFDGKSLLGVLMGAKSDEQQELVELVSTHMDAQRKKLMKAVEHYISVEEGGIIIGTIDGEGLAKWGSYFSSGKMTSLAFSHLEEKYAGKKCLMLGHGPAFITIRATSGIQDGENPFDMNNWIAQLQQEKPHAIVDGGGHPVAGTIQCMGAAKQEVMEWILKRVKQMQ